MEFGVSNLGTSNIFLGHNWLKHHNLEIDWKGKTIQFNHCPGSCYKEEIGTDPEDDTVTQTIVPMFRTFWLLMT